MNALLQSLLAQQRNCRRGEHVCSHPCQRCRRMLAWRKLNGKRAA